MFNFAVVLVVGPILTLFLFHNCLNISTDWSIFCLQLSIYVLILQYCLMHFISFLGEQLSIIHKKLSVPSKQFKSGNSKLHHNVISIYPILHSFHVLFIFFLCIFITISITQPLCTSHPPAFLVKTFIFPPMPHFSCCQALDIIPSHFLIKLSWITKPIICFPSRFSTRHFLFFLLLLCGDVEVNPGPDSVNFLKCAHLNVRSASTINKNINKPTLICELISDYKLDILTLSETWFTENTLPSILNSFMPNGYSLLQTPRPSTKSGGGVAVIYRSFLKATIIQNHTYDSFETIRLKFTISNSNFNLYTIYRPPSSSNAPFLTEFSTLLEDIISHPSEIIFFGDFNVHVDNPTSYNTAPFLTFLETYNLSQHINFPTHIHGHTLDLLITRSESNITSNICEFDPSISDHHAITFHLKVPSHTRPSQTTKFIRSLKSINITNFSNDILASDLHTVTPTSLNSYVELFSSTLSKILNKYAPLKLINISNRPQKSFITPEIKNQKNLRSRLESIWRSNKTLTNRTIYKAQARKVAKLITDSKKIYFNIFVSQNQKNPKK